MNVVKLLLIVKQKKKHNITSSMLTSVDLLSETLTIWKV